MTVPNFSSPEKSQAETKGGKSSLTCIYTKQQWVASSDLSIWMPKEIFRQLRTLICTKHKLGRPGDLRQSHPESVPYHRLLQVLLPSVRHLLGVVDLRYLARAPAFVQAARIHQDTELPVLPNSSIHKARIYLPFDAFGQHCISGYQITLQAWKYERPLFKSASHL